MQLEASRRHQNPRSHSQNFQLRSSSISSGGQRDRSETGQRSTANTVGEKHTTGLKGIGAPQLKLSFLHMQVKFCRGTRWARRAVNLESTQLTVASKPTGHNTAQHHNFLNPIQRSATSSVLLINAKIKGALETINREGSHLTEAPRAASGSFGHKTANLSLLSSTQPFLQHFLRSTPEGGRRWRSERLDTHVNSCCSAQDSLAVEGTQTRSYRTSNYNSSLKTNDNSSSSLAMLKQYGREFLPI